MLSIARSPGKTMPTAGETDSQAAPAVAVNAMGDPLVDSITVCAMDGVGGALKIRLFVLKLKVDGGEVISKLTVTTAGDATPETVIVTDDV
jgi:hypothetical protein